MSPKGLAAALLLAALSARAQVEVRPVAALPSSPGAFALAPAAALAPALSLAPVAALQAPLAASPAAAAARLPEPTEAARLPPAEARAAALSGAVAEFSRTDLSAASAGDARGAGETLMLRALGASVPDVPAFPAESPARGAPAPGAAGPPGRRAEPKAYLMSKPLRETVRLGPAALVLHVAYALAWEFAQLALVYKTTHSIPAAATYFAVNLLTTLPVASLTGRSLADLGQRYLRRKLTVLRELARTPGVARVRVLTTADVAFAGPLARQADNTGLIFVEADRELPETLGRFGAAIPLGDVASSRVALTFVQGRAVADQAWTPTLKELLDGVPLPREIAAVWRAQVKDVQARIESSLIGAVGRARSEGLKAQIRRLLDVPNGKARIEAALIGAIGRARSKGLRTQIRRLLEMSNGKARIEATLIGADGSARPIGAIVEGPAVRKLIGLGLLDRARALLGRSLPSRSIPISDSLIERPGDARAAGPKAALARAWRRLTGRLIVARE